MTSEKELYQIAIDGPSGAGKSTIARLVAKGLDITYIDTGAMYRAVAYKCIETGTSAEDEGRVISLLENLTIDLDGDTVILDGEDVSPEIRNDKVSMAASKVSQIPKVREYLVLKQRKMASSKSVVADGRDIGTNVFKDAKYKFFLTASPEERARRRFEELESKGEDVEYQDILSAIKERDYQDSHRKLNPLTKAVDAIEIDTTNMNIEEVRDVIIKRIIEN